MGGNERGHVLRSATLDRHQDDIGTGQSGGRIGGDDECLRPDAAVAAVEVADLQAVVAQRLLDARPRQKDHLAPGERQAAADIAADTAGAGNGDGLFLPGHAIVSRWPATIRHENHNVGAMAGHHV
jgi:hypothetical protein